VTSYPLPGPLPRERESGFTLIEVVVAFVILALVLMTAYEIFSRGFARVADLDDYSRALVVAESKLAATGMEEALKEGETRGESEDRRFQWSVTVKPADEGADPSKPAPSTYALYRIDVRVSWQGADARQHSVSLATMSLGART